MSENARHREYFPGCFPLRRYHLPPRLGTPLTTLIVMSCIVMHMFALYLLFLTPLLSLDTETDVAATQYDYGVDDPSLPEQPGKPPPLDHQISPILPSTACIRVVWPVTIFD